jgi:hypothetical protein
MVPSKRLLPSGIYTGDDYLICGEHDKGNNCAAKTKKKKKKHNSNDMKSIIM